MSGHTSNSTVVQAPYQYVWDRTNDVASWPRLFTEYSDAEVIESHPDSVTFRLTTVPDENGDVWSWTSRRDLNEEQGRVHARRVDAGVFEWMYLTWTYEMVPEGTRMTWEQQFQLKPDAPIDEEQMVSRINRKTAVQMDHIASVLAHEARESRR